MEPSRSRPWSILLTFEKVNNSETGQSVLNARDLMEQRKFMGEVGNNLKPYRFAIGALLLFWREISRTAFWGQKSRTQAALSNSAHRAIVD